MAWATGMGSGRAVGSLPQLFERLAADVLHDDVAGALMLDEVVDAHDVGVLDLGEEASLGDGGGHGGLVTGVEETLEHHPAVGDVAVPRQVHPAHAAVSQASGHFVLAGDEVPGVEFRGEGESRSAVGAVAFGPPRPPIPAPADGIVAAGAATPVFGHLRIGHDDRTRVLVGDRRHIDQAGAEVATGGGAARRLAGGPGRTCGGGRRGNAGRRTDEIRRAGGIGTATGPGTGRLGLRLARRSRRQATGVAVAVLDGPVAARAAASHSLRSLSVGLRRHC